MPNGLQTQCCVAGIDYSITGPAICTYKGFPEDFCFQQCRIFYLTKTKKYEGYFKPDIRGTLFPEYMTEEERFDQISAWALRKIKPAKNIILEDYAFAATGRVFNIGENAGLLKHKMWVNKKNFVTIAPTALKKFATGKGNASKDAMYLSFVQETGINLKMVLGQSEKSQNPSSDIIDAFYLCKYLLLQQG